MSQQDDDMADEPMAPEDDAVDERPEQEITAVGSKAHADDPSEEDALEGEEDGDFDEGDDASGPSVDKARPTSISEEHLEKVLESLIFVADRPVTERRLARAAHSVLAEIRPLLERLVERYRGRGVELVQVAGGY